MSFKLKKINNDDELLSFLLDPFQKSASFNNDILQKYTVDEGFDEVFLLSRERGEFILASVINYDNQTILLSPNAVFEEDVRKKPCFISRNDAMVKIIERIQGKLNKYKEDNIEALKKGSLFQRSYVFLKKEYLQQIIFQELGTSSFRFRNEMIVVRNSYGFLYGLQLIEMAKMLAGDTAKLNTFVKNMEDSPNFFEAEVVMPEILKEAQAYVEKGVFTKAELQLIDYLENTSTCNAQFFKVKKETGETETCKNEVNSNGNVLSENGLIFATHIKDIDMVIHDRKIIYKKTIY